MWHKFRLKDDLCSKLIKAQETEKSVVAIYKAQSIKLQSKRKIDRGYDMRTFSKGVDMK